MSVSRSLQGSLTSGRTKVDSIATSTQRIGPRLTQCDNAVVTKEDFAARIEALMPDLYRYAFWLSGDWALADDLVQECLLRAWRSLRSLRALGSTRSWLITILRREYARHWQRQESRHVSIDDLSFREQRHLGVNDDAWIMELRWAISRLRPRYREPLLLQILMGYTACEIGEEMGISVGAVLTRLCRARKKLAEVASRE